MTQNGPRVAVLDDWQDIARRSADWTALEQRAEVVFFHTAFASEDAAAAALAGFDVLMAMRERTAFPATLVARLPALKMFSLTGQRAASIDMQAMAARGVTVCGTSGGGGSGVTAELALGLMLAAARGIPAADAAVRAGRFQAGTAPGLALEGRVLGLIGLGRIGRRMARYGVALGMTVLAWSRNLTPALAAAEGAAYAELPALLGRSDVVSLHMVLSEGTRGLLGARELALMQDGALLINTSRGPLVDEPALIAELTRGRLRAALDVFDREPLPPDHPLLTLPNTVLTPHLGYGTADVFRDFHAKSIANVLAFLDGRPKDVLLPIGGA